MLLLFVAAVGMPIVWGPPLRERFAERILILKSAMTGGHRPAIAQVGADRGAFPAEYDNPESPIPRVPEPLPAGSGARIAVEPSVRSSSIGSSGAVVTIIEREGDEPLVVMSAAENPAAESGIGGSKEAILKYQKGEAEERAYNLLIESNSKLAEMVGGKDPLLRFIAWDAAHRDEDNFWVRLTFQSEGKRAMEYIWEVNLASKKITPLSYYARSLL